MRLLIVNTVYTGKNGITNVIFNLLGAMDSSGMEMGLVAISEPEPYYVNRLKKLGVKLYVIPRKLSSPFSYVKKLSEVARGYDIMHVHGNSATMLLEMLAARRGVVTVRIAHGHNTSCSMRWCDRLARPAFYALCNGRLACSRAAGDWLYGGRSYMVINNGIDTKRYAYNFANRSEIRSRLGWEGCKVIGHVGNFVEAKNHSFILDIFAEIVKREPKARLLLLGGYGNTFEATQIKTKELELTEKICFAGSVDCPERYLSAMDMVLMPSLFEGLPLTLVEEQANGLRCLCSDAITHDADMTGRIEFMPLTDSSSSWASRAIALLDAVDHDESTSSTAIRSIADHGFDIHAAAKQLRDYYINRT